MASSRGLVVTAKKSILKERRFKTSTEETIFICHSFGSKYGTKKIMEC
jgi:hypothetical protein